MFNGKYTSYANRYKVLNVKTPSYTRDNHKVKINDEHSRGILHRYIPYSKLPAYIILFEPC